MIKNRFLSFALVCISFLTFAQQKELTLDVAMSGEFRTEGLRVLHSLDNGKEYTVLNFDRETRSTAIDKYEYSTLNKVETIVSYKDLTEIDNFSAYSFSEDESKVLLATKVESIYRRSRLGMYFVYNRNNKTTTPVADVKIQEPTFSPDGNQVAYGYNNNLYVKNLTTGETKQLTTDGKINAIKNGITDWVYEEEFSFVRAFEWSTDSKKIAFIRFDETEVPEFSMDVYGSELYQRQHVFKYPKAGEANAVVSLHIYDLDEAKIKDVSVSKNYSDFYIPRLKWTKDANVVSAQFMNRHQNELDLWFVNTTDMSTELVLSETDKAYVDVTFNLTFLDDNSFIWTSEKDGYNHIYHYSKTGKLINQVTFGNWEVTRYYGFDRESQRIYYQSTESGSINRGVYSIGIDGKNKKALAAKPGVNSADFSADYTYFINTFSSAETPQTYTLNNAKTGEVVKTIKTNDDVLTTLSAYDLPNKTFGTLKVNGNELNMWMIKPSDFDENKKYPLLMFQYSGPGSQSVTNTWNSSRDYWHFMLAQQGVIVVCVDGRGTGYKGAEFKKVTQNELGKYEVDDQIQAAKQLGDLDYIDSDRIGIWGWSYGGFMSSNAILKGNDVFKMAIAVAPVTSWRFYDSIYTERYMTTPQENASGYDDNSPINHVDKLKGDYLLIHGSADDNVHVQNTMRMIEALVQADKQFEWMIYPDKNHGIYGGNTRKHLFTKMTNFIHKTLGDNQNATK